MAHLSYNGVCENRSFDQWCADNGVEVVTAWDAGMYGNITYKVRIAGKLLIASAYQSQHGNFTFDVSTDSREAATENCGCTLRVGQVPVKAGDTIYEDDGRMITVGHWVANHWEAWDQNGKPVWNYRRKIHPEAA